MFKTKLWYVSTMMFVKSPILGTAVTFQNYSKIELEMHNVCFYFNFMLINKMLMSIFDKRLATKLSEKLWVPMPSTGLLWTLTIMMIEYRLILKKDTDSFVNLDIIHEL